MNGRERGAGAREDTDGGVYTSGEAPAMHSFRLTWVAVGLGALLWACGPASTSVPVATPSAATADTWRVELTQSGGLMGVDLDVQVTDRGALTAIDRKSGSTVSTKLAGTQIAEIRQLLDAALRSDYAGGASQCADCFTYELALTAEDHSRTIRLDDASLAGTAAEPLVTYLVRLRDEALAAP